VMENCECNPKKRPLRTRVDVLLTGVVGDYVFAKAGVEHSTFKLTGI
jgi:hypothetical protein